MLRRTARWFTFLCGAYLGVAYFAAPGLWSLRDGRLLDMPGGMITRTPQGIAGDPINVGLVGSERDVVRAFGLAKWDTADAVTLRSAIRIGESVLFDHPYPDAPVSPLVFEGRREDLAFELPVGQSADQRHHVRFWRTDRTGDGGRTLWLGSASFDRGVGISHDTGAITHHIGPDIDAERDFLIKSLVDAGVVASVATMAGIAPTADGRNGGGDRYFTDGMVIVGTLRTAP